MSGGDQIIIEGSKIDNQYILNIKGLAEKAYSAATIESWHQRFGHFDKDKILRMREENKVHGLRITQKEKKACIECKLNKFKRTNHPEALTLRANKAASIQHMDIMGPIKTLGINKESFVLVVNDEFSAYTVTVPLVRKDQIPELVMKVINQAEIHTSSPVLEIVSDNGLEFMAPRLQIFLD